MFSSLQKESIRTVEYSLQVFGLPGNGTRMKRISKR